MYIFLLPSKYFQTEIRNQPGIICSVVCYFKLVQKTVLHGKGGYILKFVCFEVPPFNVPLST
jgi:hypothetical protein